MIDIKNIKATVHRLMPGSALDKVLEKENDEISETEFAVKAVIWDTLGKEAS